MSLTYQEIVDGFTMSGVVAVGRPSTCPSDFDNDGDTDIDDLLVTLGNFSQATAVGDFDQDDDVDINDLLGVLGAYAKPCG